MTFNQWIKSDNVFKKNENEYYTQCTQYNRAFNLMELKNYYKTEYLC